MYNRKQKNMFLDSIYPMKLPGGESNGSRDNAVYIFERLAPIEEEWGADICTRSVEDVNYALKKLASVRSHTNDTRQSLLYKYMQWCLENHVPGATDSFLHMESSNTMVYNTVYAPVDMQDYLDRVFAPEADRTIDIVYRCYLWMGFSGLYESDAYRVKCGDVDLGKMLIAYDGIFYPLYTESMLSFTLASTAYSFIYDAPQYKNRVNKERDRIGGDLLLRGFKGTPNTISPYTWRVGYSKKLRAALDDGRVDRKITYVRARLSGHFYRAWLDEKKYGESPTFQDIATEHVKRLGTADEATALNNTRQMMKEYKKDYQAWKEAWNL